jgi:hypothetical protein
MAAIAGTRGAAATVWTPGRGYDYLTLVISSWLLFGLGWDGWAHGQGLPDSFFTIWHFAFYTGYAATALVILGAVARRRPFTASWRDAIPAGYAGPVAGLVVFGVGGVFDLVWHTVFGIETSSDALLSPSHLILGLGVALIVIGPIAAEWRRPPSAGLLPNLPAVLSQSRLLSVLTFFTLFAGPYATILGAGIRPNEATLARNVLGVYFFTWLVVGLALVALRRGTLPVGAMTLIVGLNGLGMILVRGHAPLDIQLMFIAVAFAGGGIADVLLWRLRPSADRVGALRAFCFLVPFAYFALYVAAVVLRLGTGWTVHELTGIVVLSGVAGLLLSFVFVPPAAAAPRG